MLTKLKQKVQTLLTTEATIAHRVGFTPNSISAMGFLLSVLSAVAFALWSFNPPFLLLAAVILLLASGFCDALDGIVARNFQQTSVFGGFLDSLLDRYADAIIYLGIIIGGLSDVAWGLAALTGSLLVSYSRARAEAAGIRMESVGLAERAERMLILAVVTVAAIFWLPTLGYGIILLAVLANLTVLQRGWHVYKSLKKEKKETGLVSSSVP